MVYLRLMRTGFKVTVGFSPSTKIPDKNAPSGAFDAAIAVGRLFLLLRDFRHDVFHAGIAAARFAFVLHLVQLALQLGDQLVNGGIHVVMFGAGDQRAVRRGNGSVGDKPLRFFR